MSPKSILQDMWNISIRRCLSKPASEPFELCWHHRSECRMDIRRLSVVYIPIRNATSFELKKRNTYRVVYLINIRQPVSSIRTQSFDELENIFPVPHKPLAISCLSYRYTRIVRDTIAHSQSIPSCQLAYRMYLRRELKTMNIIVNWHLWC